MTEKKTLPNRMRTRKFQIFISDDEHTRLAAAAGKTDRSISAFMRFAALVEADMVNKNDTVTSGPLDPSGKSP